MSSSQRPFLTKQQAIAAAKEFFLAYSNKKGWKKDAEEKKAAVTEEKEQATEEQTTKQQALENKTTAQLKKETYDDLFTHLTRQYSRYSIADDVAFVAKLSAAARAEQEAQDEKGWTLTSDFSQALFAARSVLLEELKYGGDAKAFAAEVKKQSDEYTRQLEEFRNQKTIYHRTPVVTPKFRGILLDQADLGNTEAIHLLTESYHPGTELNLFHSPKASKMVKTGSNVFTRASKESLPYDPEAKDQTPTEPDPFSPWPLQRKFYERYWEKVLLKDSLNKSLQEKTFDDFIKNITVEKGKDEHHRDEIRKSLAASKATQQQSQQQSAAGGGTAASAEVAQPAASGSSSNTQAAAATTGSTGGTLAWLRNKLSFGTSATATSAAPAPAAAVAVSASATGDSGSTDRLVDYSSNHQEDEDPSLSASSSPPRSAQSAAGASSSSKPKQRSPLLSAGITGSTAAAAAAADHESAKSASTAAKPTGSRRRTGAGAT